ncbi:methylated-DNA--[protein]-cysteine S-methyltransferase [Aliikangiella marina]|uniref:methylated-DNA--[protein]-cysteine S-methyltransferase n=1 Tax=Aliikangiella marina TaxID=1712262 RepID=A0A545THS2_9GAMM|nr:methylated-DNA--[protein]-cysteine S-methyltransferase [Aliikangiella marina]TQV76779.1 methylated-DNA--[protein]-cysteine S-methyltransferase [Aliikangiella marina]
MIETFIIQSPVGGLKMTLESERLKTIEFSGQTQSKAPVSKVAKIIQRQLLNYFDRPQAKFEIDIMGQGTDFQRRVWDALNQIPCGQVMTYGEMAEKLGTSARAIGNACRRNPTPIVVPCHRIVAANGLGGFAGAVQGELPTIKQRLLQIEGLAPLSSQLPLEAV